MHASKLFFLLKSLDAAEFKRLGLYLRSPFYNNDRHVTALYDKVAPAYPAFTSPQLKKERIFERLFPGRPFDLNKLRKLMSALTAHVENYLTVVEREQNIFQQKNLLASAFGRRDLPGYYEKAVHALLDELRASADPGPERHYRLWQLNGELFFHPATDKHKGGHDLLEAAMEHLDAFYLLSKLQLAAEMRTREHILSEKYTIRLLDEIVRESRQSLAPKNPLADLYLQLIVLHSDSGHAALLDPVIALFETALPSINRLEQQNILHHLLNHCIRLINRGMTQYRQQLFALYQLGMEYGLLVENKRITDLTFSNVVAIGSSLKAFDWTRNFIVRYASFLAEETRDDTTALSWSLWHFNRQEYDDAGRFLHGHHFSDTLNLLKSRCLLIRIYYEQFLLNNESFFFLIDQIDAFEKAIRRHKTIAKDKCAAYLNFLGFTKKLAKKKYDRKDVSKLRIQFDALAAVTYKEWLLEKMERG